MNILNEIEKGPVSEYNGMIMFRQYNSIEGFKPYFQVLGSGQDQYLSPDNKIIIPYIEYFKNSQGQVIEELTRNKIYEIRNVPQLIYSQGESMSAGKIAVGGELIPGTGTLYQAGDLVAEGTKAIGGEIIIGTNPIDYYTYGQEMAEGTVALGGELVPGTGQFYQPGDVVVEGTIAVGGEIKRAQWNAANEWFLLLSRTPRNQQEQTFFLQNFSGIIDAIEFTLAGLPIDVPNGYILQEPLQR